MTSQAQDTKTRKPRRQFSKGLVRAEQSLLQLAEKLHASQVGTPPRSDGTCSTDILSNLIHIRQDVYGTSEIATDCDLTVQLSGFHADFGEHLVSSDLLESVLDCRRQFADTASVSETLRKLGISYQLQGRTADVQRAREEAREMILQALDHTPLLNIFEQLVRDEISESSGQSPADGTDLTPPEKNAEPQRGDVYWVKFPQFPNDPHQPRPAMIVSSSFRNSKTGIVNVVPINSRDNGYRRNLRIPANSLGQLSDGSVLQCSKLTSIDKFFLRGQPIATIPTEVVDEAVRLAKESMDE